MVAKYHDNPITGGHKGTDKEALKHEVFIPNIVKEINTYIQNCEICQR